MILEQGREAGLGVGVTIVVVCIIAIFLILIFGAVIVIIKPDLINKIMGKDGKVEDSSSKENNFPGNDVKVGDTKEFLPYERLLDYCLDLGNYNYRAIIEVSSLNYDLMSVTEQQMVDASYKAFLNALDFPIEFFIQTREFDTQAVIDDLKERSNSAVRKYPDLSDYAEQYLYEMSMITARFGNSKTKKKYVIVSFDQSDLKDVSELTKTEINNFAQEELMQRASIVMAGLKGVGLTATLLDRPGIAEVLYSYYHRDNFRIAKDIVDGSLTSLVINGPEHRTDPRHSLDQILSYAQSSIKGLVTSSSTDEELKLYKYIFNELEKYKQDDVPMDMAHLFYNTREAAEREGYLDSYFRYVKAHPETDFSNLSDPAPEHSVTIPERIKDEVLKTPAENPEKDYGEAIGSFDPASLKKEKKRRRA